VFIYSRGNLVFASKDDPLDELWPQISGKSPGMVLPGEVYQVNEWWKLTSSTVKEFALTSNPYVCFADGTNFTVPLTIRGFRDGERFSPFGMNGKKVKLGDFWTNEGLPERARKKWPLVCHADEIVWVPGFRVSENFRVSPATSKIIRMEIKRTGPG
jgi:tRNA(Ile)-lysidine synthetase-like protein